MKKFATVRLIAFPLGIAIHIYAGLNGPLLLRTAQAFSRSLADMIEDLLPDAYAVWQQILNLDSRLVMIMFTIVIFIGVELVPIGLRSISCCY